MAKKLIIWLIYRKKSNEYCNNAIKRLFTNISIIKINEFIDNIDCISKIRKDFYKKVIEQRYKIIKNVYETIQ